MSDCIFCKLAGGEIPTATLYEDDSFRVILDANPASKGHALILPKAHYADITAMPDELLGDAMILAKKMGAKLMDRMESDGLNVVQNNGETAGQTVFHFHIHLIPRYAHHLPIVGWIPGTLTEKAKNEILEKMSG